MRYAFLLELDGAAFSGTQSQINAPALQDELERALLHLGDGAAVGVRLASRLDAGVGAELLPCDCLLPRAWPPYRLAQALQGHLGAGVAVRAAAAVEAGFHSIRSARSKCYRYRVRVRDSRPVLDPRAWWLRRLDHPHLLRELAGALTGRRDLRAFACLRHDDSDDDDGTREILAAEWARRDDACGTCHELRISATGFLYKQVRGLVGAMVHVAQGRRSAAEFHALVAGAEGVARIGNIAPPEGLCLERVRYDPEPAWVWL
ncbi:MAG: hypothetical protein L6R48_00375 [Planctomycetes bacterium]|nr:hypothetical protein [Planctomycetota bacterium]